MANNFNKDAAIVAQNATTPAAQISAAIIMANPEHPTTTESALDLFDTVRRHIFAGSMELAGVENVIEYLGATPAAATRGTSGGSRSQSSGVNSGGSKVPGETVVNMGKHKGKTIADIHAEQPDYLTWLVEKGNNEFLKRQVKAFLADV